MRGNNILTQAAYFFLFMGMHILIFKNLSLFNYAPCFIYVGFILLLPFSTPPILLISLAFISGLIIDIFYDTIGINAAACVLVAYIRPYIINLLTPKGGYDKGVDVTVQTLGFQWLVSYAAIIIFIHHLTLFILELWGIKLFFNLLGKTVVSTLFTLFVFILFQYLLLKPRKS